MAQPKPICSRKRSFLYDGAKPSGFSTYEAGPVKRQRKISLQSASLPDLRLSVPNEGFPPTPPLSVTGPVTMALKLTIPQEHISREQQKKLNRRKLDAERWKPKLQRPYPKWSEMKIAYPLKLMRHYPDATARVQANFVKPRIDKSPRLSHLLEQFPLMESTQRSHAGGMSDPLTPVDQAIPLSARLGDLKEAQLAHRGLQKNIDITKTEHAQRLAWRSFALPEQGRIDRGREAMIQSGLPTDDLILEAAGRRNDLPDWKRPWTGRFAMAREPAS
ncbi:hypothetical protein C7974DRAFT_47508 [Boeremia exigua]|uniref:uncharacterized protein n=1 Tax=Boeremia exigua TaxID=749465 RepID=UPI001E8D562A|nr:uncharacterized protein C7974DRAFT_47508 [Boeremia exigua]KAH6616563.1 hypothetical protein C7974DRAFT_47508 [Boeremia exigua]